MEIEMENEMEAEGRLKASEREPSLPRECNSPKGFAYAEWISSKRGGKRVTSPLICMAHR